MLSRRMLMASAGRNTTSAYFHDLLTGAGLSTGLIMSLDVADPACYVSSTSLLWSDRSDSSNSFHLGSSGTTDIEFVGTVGAANSGTYFQVGTTAGFFRAVSTNSSDIDSIHKDGASFTIAAVVYVPDLSGTVGFIGDTSADAGTGFWLGGTVSEKLRYEARRVSGATGVILDTTSTLAMTPAAWNFIGVSISENSTDGGVFKVNSSAESFAPTYAGPGTTSASQKIEIGSFGLGGQPTPVGTRYAGMFMWIPPLTAAQLEIARTAVMARFST